MVELNLQLRDAPVKQFNVKLYENTIEDLRECSTKYSISLSNLVRHAINNAIAEFKEIG